MPILTANQTDEMYRELTKDFGFSPEKATLGLQIVADFCKRQTCPDCTSQVCRDCRGRQQAEYRANSRGETKSCSCNGGSVGVGVTKEIIAEIGKVALLVKAMALKAKADSADMQKHMKSKPDAQNALAEVKQKVKSALGKMDLTAKLLKEKEQTQKEIHARIDSVEAGLRGRGHTSSVPTVETAASANPERKVILTQYEKSGHHFEPYEEPDFSFPDMKVVHGGGGLSHCVSIPFPS